MSNLSRYNFTDSNGYVVGNAVEAASPAAARAMMVGRTGHTGPLNCNHLSDDHSGEGADRIFFYGPDAVGG